MNYTLRYSFPRFIGKFLAHALTHLRVTGKENIPAKGPFLLICNHISHFDPPLLAVTIPHYLAWVVAADLYTNSFIRIYCNYINAIPINRQVMDRRAVKEILARAKLKESVAIFPEGGIRFGPDSLLNGHPLDETIGAISHLTHIPILPSLILGSDKLYHPKNWFRKITVDIAFAPVISPKQFSGSSSEVRHQINQATTQTILKLYHETKERFQLTERDLPMSVEARLAGL